MIPTPDELAAIDGGALPETLVEQAGLSWDLIASDDGIGEFRVPKHLDGRSGVASGYARSKDEFLRMVAQYHSDPTKARGVYATINPVNPALYALSPGGVTRPAETTTKDADIVRRRLLYIDVDSNRPSSYISATDEEREAALRTTAHIARYLADTFSFPDPAAIGSSGNGGCLYYRIDLPNDADSLALIEKVLAHLADAFNSDAVTVDTTVANAARIAKIFGTASAKGYATEDRPWRYALGFFTPNPETVTREQLEAVAAQTPQPEEPTKKESKAKSESQSKTEEPRGESASNKTGEQGKSAAWLEAALTEKGIGFTVKDAGYALTYRLDRCLTSGEHQDGAVIQVMQRGAYSYSCLHTTCAGKGWYDVREQLGFGRGRPDQKTGSDNPIVGYTHAELRNLPPVKPLYGDVLTEKGFALMSSDPGIGKTTVALAIAHGIATGSTVYDKRARQGGVVYLAAEGVSGLAKRMDGLVAHTGKPFGDNFRVIGRALDLVNDTDALIDWCKALPELPALFVGDTVARTQRGDENSTRDMSAYIAACDRIREALGCAVLLLHHNNKTGSYRGSSALLGAVDTHIEIEATATGCVLKCAKQKDSAPFAPIPLKKVPVALGEPDSILDVEIGQVSTLSALVFEVDDRSDETGGLTQLQRTALRVLADEDDWVTVTDWVDLAETSTSSLKRTRHELKRQGWIEVKDAGRSKLNRITDAGRLALDPQPKATVSRNPFAKKDEAA